MFGQEVGLFSSSYLTYMKTYMKDFSLSPLRIHMMKSANRMDARNISVVFAPTLMRSPENTGDLSAVHKLPQQRKAVEILITHCHKLFQY